MFIVYIQDGQIMKMFLHLIMLFFKRKEIIIIVYVYNRRIEPLKKIQHISI